MTARDLVTLALRRIGVLAAGQDPTGEDATTALITLNALLDGWKTERLITPTVSATTFPITAGKGSYSVGGARPVFVDHVTYMDSGGYERELMPLTDAQYARLPDKTRQGTPTHYYYNPTFPEGTLILYPVPDRATTGVFYAPNPVQEFTSLNDEVALPPGYFRMLLTNLAKDLLPEFTVPADVNVAKLEEQARESMASMKRSNTRLTDLAISTPFGRGSY